MTRERDIVHENGRYWVLADRDGFTVMRNDATHAVSDSTYANKSLAIARADYLAKRSTKT